jgi:hypothetical protein
LFYKKAVWSWRITENTSYNLFSYL